MQAAPCDQIAEGTVWDQVEVDDRRDSVQDCERDEEGDQHVDRDATSEIQVAVPMTHR